MSAKSKSIILAESSKLIRQIGNSITLQLSARIQQIEALVRTIAAVVANLPASEALIHELVPPLIDFNSDLGIAGGGVWYEPYAFTADRAKHGFFWCRHNQSLKYLDSYNQSERGYHQEAWYVVARYLAAGQCFWSESYMDPFSYEPMVTCTAPLLRNQQFVGAVTVDLRLERLQATVETFRKKTGGYIFILDWKNKFISFPQPHLVKKLTYHHEGIQLEEFILADEFLSKEPLFDSIAAGLNEMNQDLLNQASNLSSYQSNIAEELSQSSDRISRFEAELMNAAIADPLRDAFLTKQSNFYKQFEVDTDFLQQEASTVFLFHVPRSYWKVVIVKPFSEAAMSTYSIIQAEKMSSLGQFVAGMAHEINNPISFVYGNLQHANAYMQDLLKLIELYQQHYPAPIAEIEALTDAIDFGFIRADLPKLFTSMQVGTDRIRQLVLSLRNFSRTDESELKIVNIHEGINNTLLLLESRLTAKLNRPEIRLIKEYGDLPLVECYPGLLNQVFMNILINAIDALEEGQAQRREAPTIQVCTALVNAETIAIRIIDNGLGIPEPLQSRLFDPFFTTKPIGKGTGLGLAICYQIITEKHSGQLQCVSSAGQGTQFLITLPVRHDPTLHRA